MTLQNVELYVDKCKDFYLNSGIHEQVCVHQTSEDNHILST